MPQAVSIRHLASIPGLFSQSWITGVSRRPAQPKAPPNWGLFGMHFIMPAGSLGATFFSTAEWHKDGFEIFSPSLHAFFCLNTCALIILMFHPSSGRAGLSGTHPLLRPPHREFQWREEQSWIYCCLCVIFPFQEDIFHLEPGRVESGKGKCSYDPKLNSVSALISEYHLASGSRLGPALPLVITAWPLPACSAFVDAFIAKCFTVHKYQIKVLSTESQIAHVTPT